MGIEYTISGSRVNITEEVDTGNLLEDNLPNQYYKNFSILESVIVGVIKHSLQQKGKFWSVSLVFDGSYCERDIQQSVIQWLNSISKGKRSLNPV